MANFKRITETQAGTQTAELTWYVCGKVNTLEVSLEDKEAALAEVFNASLVQSVSVVVWVHSHNLPGCLPLVKSNSCSLTQYERVAGEIVETPIDIFGGGY